MMELNATFNKPLHILYKLEPLDVGTPIGHHVIGGGSVANINDYVPRLGYGFAKPGLLGSDYRVGMRFSGQLVLPNRPLGTLAVGMWMPLLRGRVHVIGHLGYTVGGLALRGDHLDRWTYGPMIAGDLSLPIHKRLGLEVGVRRPWLVAFLPSGDKTTQPFNQLAFGLRTEI